MLARCAGGRPCARSCCEKLHCNLTCYLSALPSRYAVEHDLPAAAEQIYSGRLNDAQAVERGSPAYCDGQTHLSAVRMTDQVHGAAGSMDDGLDDVRLVVDRNIAL